MTRLSLFGLPLALLPLLTAGCLKRGEAIAIRPDGSVRMLVMIQGDPDDVRSGDAMPSKEGGWQVSEQMVKEDDKDQLKITAERTVPAGQPIPSSYAVPGSPGENQATTFTTKVRIEQRPDGTYYHFRRVYHARPAARILHLRGQILENDEMKALAGKDIEELSDDERRKFVAAMIQFEKEKTRVFLDQAGAALGDGLAQDQWLPARERALKPYDEAALMERTIAALSDKDQAGPLVEQIEHGILQQVEEGIRTAMQEAKAPKAAVDRFVDAYGHARAAYNVTEDIGDEVFEIAVEMPGRIIAHNVSGDGLAPAGDAEVEPAAAGRDFIDVLKAEEFKPAQNRCGWSFKGEDLRDDDVVLMATSVVAK